MGLLVVVLAGFVLASSFEAQLVFAKRKRAPVKPPDLRVVSVAVSPNPFAPGDGVLDFHIVIELPQGLDTDALLEVSSLINSPSMSSMRFLVVRQPVEGSPAASSTSSEQTTQAKPRVEVTLSWDGLDQANELVTSGRYEYEVSAKLLAVGENGPRTQMNSWPKRGSLVVK